MLKVIAEIDGRKASVMLAARDTELGGCVGPAAVAAFEAIVAKSLFAEILGAGSSSTDRSPT
jgi:hypothetical protein